MYLTTRQSSMGFNSCHPRHFSEDALCLSHISHADSCHCLPQHTHGSLHRHTPSVENAVLAWLSSCHADLLLPHLLDFSLMLALLLYTKIAEFCANLIEVHAA